MTVKAYIVANKQQELDILNKFEQKGLFWRVGKSATNFVPSENTSFYNLAKFPYALIENGVIIWSSMEQLENETIVYDGRKEEQMDKKYKVTQVFMNELIEWRDHNNLDALNGNWQNTFRPADFKFMPDIVSKFRFEDESPIERNNRLIAIIKWLNGEDVFEVEKTHKFIVRNDTPDYAGDYYYVQSFDGVTNRAFSLEGATKFDTREEAQEWANSHQVVVEIDEGGNEVE